MSKNKSKIDKVHPWRPCPYGSHWVREHNMQVNGKSVIRKSHCALNPSRKDQLFPDEILEIQKKFFNRIKNTTSVAPMTKLWNFKNNNKDKYDVLINGWTRYWNEVFNSSQPLDPNIVKSLIASESGFNDNIVIKAAPRNFARGLMQITDETLKILADEKGELKDHYVTLTKDDALNPSLNICGAIRWLFRKKETASSKLKREATWEEVVMDYKAILGKVIQKKDHNKNIMIKFNQYLLELKGKK